MTKSRVNSHRGISPVKTEDGKIKQILLKISGASLSRASQGNTTSVRGISLSHYTNKLRGKTYTSFQASWPTISGKTAVKKVSIGVRSKEDAMRIARKARADGLRQYLRDLQKLR